MELLCCAGNWQLVYISRLHFLTNASYCGSLLAEWREAHGEALENVHKATSFGLSPKNQPESFREKSTGQQHKARTGNAL